MKGSIYYLKNKDENVIRYVGQTILSLEKRLKSHIYETKRNLKLGKFLTHKENWIISLINENNLNKIEIHLIEECDISIIDEKEIFWINYYKDCNLTNIDIGGKRTFVTDETKKKISMANSGEKNGMFGNHNKPNEIIKKNRGEGMRNSKKFQDSRKSEEFRKKISILQKIDDVFLLDNNFEIIKVFNSLNEVSKYLGCTSINVRKSRQYKRLVCKKYWVVYRKDYDDFINNK
jgi:hypothetical protein